MTSTLSYRNFCTTNDKKILDDQFKQFIKITDERCNDHAIALKMNATLHELNERKKNLSRESSNKFPPQTNKKTLKLMTSSIQQQLNVNVKVN